MCFGLIPAVDHAEKRICDGGCRFTKFHSLKRQPLFLFTRVNG